MTDDGSKTDSRLDHYQGLSTGSTPGSSPVAPGSSPVKSQTFPRSGDSHFHIFFIFLFDLVSTGIATGASILIRARINTSFLRDDQQTEELLTPIALMVVPTWLILIALFGCYQRKQLGSGTTEYSRVLNASLLMAGLLGISAYLLQYPMSRAFYFLVFSIGIPLVLVERYAVRHFLKRQRIRGRFRRRVLLAGDLLHLEDLLSVLTRESWLGYEPIGIVTRDPTCQGSIALPIIDNPENILRAVRDTHVDAVIFTEGAYLLGRDFNRLSRELEHERAELIVVPSLSDVAAARMTVRPAGGIPLVHIEKPQAMRAGTWLTKASVSK